ncbi:variant sh3 domain-containing protein [Ophiostoma piceae UAMH 11346]|uniref:Variant sh3 domain-containing protein n=1 Tax=Ophiostoma piceae (strain UAMH 11346) TaxID=1262450 RepID=S3CU83_OPHP1|nr:variant sh3 domain-containing protein [Ophiostoma piceae UAMH 11346]
MPVLGPPPLPMRFPCWCRAVYSWGGESKRDLGFMEGDLIECLNAGDGSWWTGRLFRDRRMVGAFPSNFVEVLPEDFRPITRSVSPLPAGNTPSPKTAPQKSKTFRKPFEAYAKAPHYTTAKKPETFAPGAVRSRETSTNSVNSTGSGAGGAARRPRNNSVQAMANQGMASHARQNSNSAVNGNQRGQGMPSPGGEPLDSPPPPPPPPHRHTFGRQDSNASYDPQSRAPIGGIGSMGGMASMDRQGSGLSYNSHLSGAGYHTPRAASPMPSPGGGGETGLTPSPLREAMDDVMEQLHTLGMSRDEARTPDPMAGPPPVAFDAWSPDSFNTVHQQSRRVKNDKPARPQTSMGISQPVDEGYETFSGSGNSSQNNTQEQADEEKLPQLSNYVERMESRLRTMHQKHQQVAQPVDEAFVDDDEAPMPPPKRMTLFDRPKSSMGNSSSNTNTSTVADVVTERQLRHRRSAYDVGRQVLSRTFTTKTNSTNASSGNQSTATTSSTNTQSTNRSLMSGASASALSATSAGSLARKNHSRAQSALGLREWENGGHGDNDRPDSPFTGVTYHSSHATEYQQNGGRPQRPKSQVGFHSNNDDMPGLGGLSGLGGLTAPKSPKKGSNIFKKIIESAKTGVASSRGSIAMTGFGNSTGIGGGGHSYSKSSPMNGLGISSHSHGSGSNGFGRDAGKDMGLGGSGGGVDWVQVRRDVNRSNSLSRIERNERRDRCQMLDYPTLDPVDELYNTIDGDEGADGMPIAEPTNYSMLNLSQVDKNSRFISGLPPMTTAITLATTYVCRPYRSDVQRLRAIFTWVSEKIVWEDDYEVGGDSNIDTRRVIQAKRGCAEEYAVLVAEMCMAANLPCEVVRGYLKAPGDIPELGIMPRSNHYWNAVLVDNEWRIMDCCLASPSFPRRSTYSSGGGSSTAADPWWFLVQPSEACYTHIPEHHTQQHLCPPVAHEILQNLPCAGPPYFRNGLQLMDFNTSLLRIEDLEMVHVRFSVPEDVEVAAEVEVRALTRDADGDYFESGDVIKKRALAQADWIAGGIKRYTVKGLLPGDEGTGILKVYAGKRGLMHSIKDIPHPLAFSLPVVHTGENPNYEYVLRHPTPHAQRHDIYVVQPQCQRLALNNTFVFAIRQHPSSVSSGTPMLTSSARAPSPSPFARPSSAMSMLSNATSGFGGNNHSNMIPATASVSGSSTTSGGSGNKKPAKLAIQTPGGKILRLMRKEDRSKSGAMGVGGVSNGGQDEGDGGTWETIIKCSERGVWRGLVLADRTARWCVFAEWVCQ